ncbi:MAG: WYL domain-containing protein [Muribaculaceae bacterium]|nr:WYL domain-containing protein [Muribaculaceae bacterium]
MEEGVTIKQLIVLAAYKKLTLEIDYVKGDNEKSTRIISNISLSSEYGIEYISAFCHLKNEQRTFKISRIVDAHIVPSGSERMVRQSCNYEFDANKPIFNLYGDIY